MNALPRAQYSHLETTPNGYLKQDLNLRLEDGSSTAKANDEKLQKEN